MRAFGRWLILGVVAAGPAYADDISGTYVGTGANSAFLIQIVETSGGQLTGRYEQTLLEPSGGKLDQTTFSMTGASNGQTIAVTMRGAQLLSGSITASGTIQGSLLHLSGSGTGGNVDLNLTKSDEITYKMQIAKLSLRGRQVIESAAKAELLARLDKLTQDMATDSGAAEAQLDKFSPIEQRFRALTDMMDKALTRQRSIFGGSQAFLARGQIGVEINQGGVEAEQLHVSLQDAGRDMAAKLQPLVSSANDLIARCTSNEMKSDAGYHAACALLFKTGKTFQENVEKLRAAFDHAEKVWVEEHAKQLAIIRAADVASR
ncbi:MAG: hypothetical protein WB760_08075 [Xanthobacteraceae bacterium]